MAYATANSMVQAFGLDELAQLLFDEQRLLTPQLLRDAMAGVWTGSPSADEMAAATAALARLTTQIGRCSNFMDGYLRAKIKLPIAPQHADAGTLADCCHALVRSALADDAGNATDRMETQAATWRAWLKDVAAGRALLAGDQGQEVPTVGGIKTGQAKSGYNWAAFGGVR